MINEIRNTLDNEVEAQTTLPLQRENTHYEPGLLEPWLRTTIIPTETRNLTRGPNPLVAISGLFQIDVFYPAGTGTTDANATTKTLLDHLYTNRTLTINDTHEVRIITVWEDVAITSPDWYNAKVTLRFETFNQT